MRVGFNGVGKILRTGQGGGTFGFLAFQSSSTGTITDVSQILRARNTTTASFPGNNINDSLYFAVNVTGSSGDLVKLSGFETYLHTLAVSGAIVWENWNGSTWQDVTSTATELGNSYRDIGTSSFSSFTPQQIRFDQFKIANNTWIKNTPSGFSFTSASQYWMRARITSPFTTPPKIYSMIPRFNSTDFGPDGFGTYFGMARPIRALAYNLNTAVAAFGAAPNAQDLALSDNLDIGFAANQFSATAANRIGLTFPMPLDCDTSCPLIIRWSWVGSSANTGNVVWNVRYAYSIAGDTVYLNTGTAPTTGTRELSVQSIVSGAFGGIANTVTTNVVTASMPNFPVRQGGQQVSCTVWLTLERNGADPADTYTGTTSLFDLGLRYFSWAEGGHTSAVMNVDNY